MTTMNSSPAGFSAMLYKLKIVWTTLLGSPLAGIKTDIVLNIKISEGGLTSEEALGVSYPVGRVRSFYVARPPLASGIRWPWRPFLSTRDCGCRTHAADASSDHLIHPTIAPPKAFVKPLQIS